MTDMSQANDGNTMGGTSGETGGGTTAEKFKSQFASFKGQATDKARDYAGQGVEKATGALDEAARFLEETAQTIEEKLGPQYGRYGFSAAESVSGFAEQLRGKDVDELVEDVRALVRKSPAVAIGAAVGLGFVLARLVKAGAGYESTQGSSPAGTGGTSQGTKGAPGSALGGPRTGTTDTPGTGMGADSALVGTSTAGSTDLSAATGGTGGLGGTANADKDSSPITPTFPA